MKLQRSTGILLGVAASLVTTVAVLETQKSNTDKQNSDTLYSFAEADVSALTIEQADTALEFSNTNGTWYMDSPESGPAEPSAIAFLLNILTSSTIKETITSKPDKLETYGLDNPNATVKMTTLDKNNHTLIVGDADFSNTALYVMQSEKDTDAPTVEIHLVVKDLENGLKRPPKEWLLSEEGENKEDIEITE